MLPHSVVYDGYDGSNERVGSREFYHNHNLLQPSPVPGIQDLGSDAAITQAS